MAWPSSSARAFLVTAVIGSGIAASRLSPDDVGLQLLENSLVTGAALVALILALQPVSAAFNPVVTLVERALGAGRPPATRCALVAAQIVGGVVGAVLANLMFDLDAVISSPPTHRATPATLARRGRRDRWAGPRHLRLGAVRPHRPRRLRGRWLHHRGVLVHQLDQLRQPRRHDRADVLRHLRRASRRPRCRCSSSCSCSAERSASLLVGLYPTRAWPSQRPRPRPRGVRRVSERMPDRRLSCSSASTTPAARRWRPAGCAHLAGDRVEVRSAGSAARRPGQPGRRRGDGRGRHRHHRRAAQDPHQSTRSRSPTSSSRWAAATPARSSPASATRTGTSTTRPGRASRPSARSATRSAGVSRRWWPICCLSRRPRLLG